MTQGKFAEAEPLLHEALAASRAFLPAGHRDIATALGNLAMVLDRQDKHEEAEPVLRESIDLLRASVPADHPHLVATLRFLAHFYERRGKVDQAVPVRRELLGSTRASLPKDSPELAVHLMAFSESLITLEQWGEAEGVLRECLTIREKAEPDAWTTWNTRSWLGAAMLGQKKFAEAEALLLAGYRGLKEREASIPPAGAIRIPRAIERLVQLYEAMGNATEAAAWRGRLEAARAKVPAPHATGGQR